MYKRQAVAFIMVREKNGKELDRISVIIQDSEDNQWAAFQYGLKMAEQDLEVRMSVVSTGGALPLEEMCIRDRYSAMYLTLRAFPWA